MDNTGTSAAQVATTLDNLQTAFNGESNARASYLAFARKADDEGYGPVASLFRAAARAEQIHAANHARVIEKLGAKPVANVLTPEVRSTRENLETAIQGETYERDVMYPGFLAKARADENDAAADTFYLAGAVEAEHADLYTAALHDLEKRRGAGVTYYVCPVCGSTAAKIDFDVCPVCATPEEQFEAIR